MSSLVKELRESVSPEVIAKIAKNLGESEAGVTKCLKGAFLVILDGILQKNSGSQVTGFIENFIKHLKDAPEAQAILSKPDELVSLLQGKGALAQTASESLQKLFGDCLNQGISGLAEMASIKESSAKSLLAMAYPLVVSQLGKDLGGKFTALGIKDFLSPHKEKIAAALPKNLGELLYSGQMHSASVALNKKGPSGLIKFILLLALLAALLYGWKYCLNKEVPVELPAASLWSHLGEMEAVSLPDGVTIQVPRLGVEHKLITFLNDSSLTVENAEWISFDRLLFAVSSAQLQPASKAQLENFAAILKAYPKANVKLGGYTDNTGDIAHNLALSENRATNVSQELIKLGIDAGRIESEGYGEKHPVAENDTDENRAKNRRIDIKVTKK